MPTVTRLERQKKHPERVNVYLDGEFAFGLPDIDAARLSKGQTLSEAEVALLRTQDTLARAVDQGLRLLASRPRSFMKFEWHWQESMTQWSWNVRWIA